MNKIFCISAGQKVTKKTDHIIHRQNRYLNYGLLSLTSVLKRSGLEAVQVQGNFDDPEFVFSRCVSLGITDSTYPVLISVPSFYAVSWANEFIQLVRNYRPKAEIIVGGRWVVDGQAKKLHDLMPLSNKVVAGTAERLILNLVNKKPNQMLFGEAEATTSLLDYKLLIDREQYQPSIEISRGCGMGCSFCQERDEALTKLKPAALVVEEAEGALLEDNLPPMNCYFEASMFTPNSNWVLALRDQRDASGMNFKWRTEARVDSVAPRHLAALYQAGLRILDLGLESADHGQLVNMQKTSNPEKYLHRASELIQAAHAVGIKVKVNILLYPGETFDSIENTLNWLRLRRNEITGLSVGPVIVFGWPDKVSSYLAQLKKLGASTSHSPVTGVTHLNLSSAIDFEKSMDISASIGREFTSADNYYFLKSFSYFSRNYTKDQFLADCKGVEHLLNFSVGS